MKPEEPLAELHKQLGYRPLSRLWAKLEILLGLSALGVGLFLGPSIWVGGEILWPMAGAALALFVLGGYLAPAGHRSHLYQSSNEQIIYLAALIHHLKDKD